MGGGGATGAGGGSAIGGAGGGSPTGAGDGGGATGGGGVGAGATGVGAVGAGGGDPGRGFMCDPGGLPSGAGREIGGRGGLSGRRGGFLPVVMKNRPRRIASIIFLQLVPSVSVPLTGSPPT